MQKLLINDVKSNNSEVMSNNELKLYAARDTTTGKLVSDLTNPRKKFWHIKSAAQEAIRKNTSGKYKRYDSLELVTFRLVEVTENE